MPSWRPLPRIAFAICVYPFQPSSPADLPLEIGDELYIIEQGGKDGSWYRGYLVAPPSLLAGLTSVKGQTLEARVFSGIFPRCCVEIREVLGEGRIHGRNDERGSLPPGSSGRSGGTRSSDGEPQGNGVLTPSESVSASSLTRKSSASRSKPSKSDSATGVDSTRPPSGRAGDLKETKRILSNGFRQTSQQILLPLSPISVKSRDPNCPRPPAPVPMLKIGDETSSAEEPLVDEIASCLREWHSTNLHELLLVRKYGVLDRTSALVQRLDSVRRQLLHKVLTAQELRRVREATVWDLVNGNKMLCGEVIVRSPSQRGRILTADDSAIEITQLQSMMSLLDERPQSNVDEHTLHHLLVNITSYAGDVTQPSTLTMYLCLKSPGSSPRALSEVYSVDLPLGSAPSANLLEGKIRTLFVDLSSTDLGEGPGSGSNLYLVFRVISSEPYRPSGSSAGPAPPRESTSSNHHPGISPSAFGSIKGGRRSLMWGGKGRKDSDASQKSIEHRPASGDADKGKGHEHRPPSATARATPSKDQKCVKKTVGLGVLQIDSLIKGDSDAEQEVTFWTPAGTFDEHDEDAANWDNLIPEINPSISQRYKKCGSVNRLHFHVKQFVHTDAEYLIRKTPTLLHNVTPTPKIGFSGAPTKPRSDIYLTITEASLPRHALLSHPKSGTAPLSQTTMTNLQLTLEVRRPSGERIENCIFPSCNSVGHTAWRTPAVERGEAWNFTIRLAIDPQDVPGSHIVMSIADAPNFPFALCWMPLWTQDAFVRDGNHILSLYKYDEYTSSMISGKGAYLALPWVAKIKDDSVTGPMAVLRLHTYLCSTKYSQDPNLLGLLRWRSLPAGEIANLLRRFSFVPEIEIVKLLNEVFDALFEILIEYAGSDEYEDLVLNSLVIVLGIVHDRRFNLGPLVDQYADKRFKHPFATSCLMRSFNRLLANPVDPDTSRKLRATFKVGRHIFKFIMNARQQQKEKEAGIGITSRQSQFTKDLQNIFKSLEALMLNPAPILIGTKTLVVQHLYTWLPELAFLLPPDEILKLAAGFIQSCASAQGKLILYKLVLIIHFSQLEIFKAPEIRKALLQHTVGWLAPHWGKTNQVTEQWKDQVRLCCSVVAQQVQELGKEASEYIPKLVDSYRAIQATHREPRKTLSLLFPTSYPFPTRPTTTDAVFDEALVEISAVLAATTNLPTSIDIDLPKQELADFLFDALQVYISILDGEAFPCNWLSVHIYHHKATIRTLEKLSNILIDSFVPHPDEADQFNTELWRAFFDALLKLVGSEALALETFPEQKRRAVWKIAGDVREIGADLLRRTWESVGWETSEDDRKQYGLEKMGGYQVQYVPGLVAPILELCLSVHEGLRGVAIEVLQTMIVSEWTLSQDLAIIQAEMIDCLDQLFKTKTITESILQKLFIGELMDLFEPFAQVSNDPLFNAVKNLITTIDELLDLLVAVHSTENTGEIFHIMDTLHLMEFLKDMQKEDIYIRYVHQLARLQAEAKNFTEAGLALRLHSELYEWDPAEMVEALIDPAFPAQTAFDRKEQLYFQMIKHFEDGQSWDHALSAYIELSQQYEHNIFDFAKLARTQRAMATIYESIGKGERQNPRYFRVVYKGMGFPIGLRDKQFIFEGLPNDRMAAFTDRMQQQHPAAQLLTAGVEDVEGQYLQIYPVSVQKDLLHPIYQRTKVSQPIREYYLLSRPSHFTTTSRRKPSEAGLKNESLEKTVYTTAEAFPTILRRSEIISVGKVTLTPVQTAVERTTRKTAELTTLERRAAEGEDSAVLTLTEALMLSVDPASESSVYHYRDLLPQDNASIADTDGEEVPPLDIVESALKVALIDHALAVKRCLSLPVYSRPAHQATKADLHQRFEQTFAPELSSLHPNTQLPPLVRSPISSWQLASTPSLTSQPAAPPSQAPKPNGIPVASKADTKITSHEKHRLSLTFLRRTSIIDHRDHREGRKINGTLEETDRESQTTSTRSRSKDHGKHRLSFLHHTTSNDASLTQNSSPRSPSTERPETSKSEHSVSHSIGSRVGSVKKRLSLLHIGKKQSKTSVKGRVDGALAEE